MHSRIRVLAMTTALALGGAFLVAGPSTGCLGYSIESALATADFCFIFDCQNGILGGTIDPCPPVDDSVVDPTLSPPTGPVFVDCPEISGP